MPVIRAAARAVMRYELFIGLRYLRAKRREVFISLITLISTVGVAIGVMTLNIVLSVMTGFEEDLRDRILGFNAHVIVWSGTGMIEDYGRVLARIGRIEGVTHAAPLINAELMLTTADHVTGALLRGVRPDAQDADDLGRHMREGSIEELSHHFAVPLGEGRGSTVRLPGIILGAELARRLDIDVGKTVNVAIPLGRGAQTSLVPRLTRFVVAGIFDSGMPEYDAGLAFVGLSDAQRLYGLGDAVNNVEVRVKDLYQAPEVAARIRAALGPSYRVRDWIQANHNLFSVLQLQKTVYFIVLLLIILVAAFTILATLIMVVMEKRKDIAILKSMGATRGAIGRIFVFKGLTIGAVGTVAGNLGGYAGCWMLEHYHFIELPAAFYVTTVPVKMYPELFVAVTAASLAICLLATIYPARQAARLVPVDVIRYE
jgi:lipoprotein-releasing system permease protein